MVLPVLTVAGIFYCGMLIADINSDWPVGLFSIFAASFIFFKIIWYYRRIGWLGVIIIAFVLAWEFIRGVYFGALKGARVTGMNRQNQI